MKDLEKLLCLGSSSSSSSSSSSASSQNSIGLKTKPASLSRQEGRQSGNGRSLVDWPHPQSGQPLEAKEAAAPLRDRTSSSQEVHKVQQHKLEGRRGSRREGEGEEGAQAEEQRRRRGGRGHLEKTVSIRLVDIRMSDCDGVNTLSKGGIPAPLQRPHSPGRPTGGALRGWGKFRIPRRGSEGAGTEPQKPPPQMSNTLVSPPRTRLRSVSTESQAEDGAAEPCLKRCHSHQLRGDTPLVVRRYGPDIIRRGVLAS